MSSSTSKMLSFFVLETIIAAAFLPADIGFKVTDELRSRKPNSVGVQRLCKGVDAVCLLTVVPVLVWSRYT